MTGVSQPDCRGAKPKLRPRCQPGPILMSSRCGFDVTALSYTNRQLIYTLGQLGITSHWSQGSRGADWLMDLMSRHGVETGNWITCHPALLIHFVSRWWSIGFQWNLALKNVFSNLPWNPKQIIVTFFMYCVCHMHFTAVAQTTYCTILSNYIHIM